jgi:hypothetical protein
MHTENWDENLHRKRKCFMKVTDSLVLWLNRFTRFTTGNISFHSQITAKIRSYVLT